MLSLLTPRQSDAVGGPIGSMREAKTVASYPNYDAAYLAKRLGAKNPKALERNRYLSGGQFTTAQNELVYLQNATKGYEAEAEECLKKEFKEWLTGTHEDNYMPKVYDNTKGGAIRRDMSGRQLDGWKPTWWGPHQLTYLPGVREYLREQATLADKNSLDMNKLAHLGPQNVEEAWAYFKHWVKGRPVGPEECLRDSAKKIGDIERPFRAGPIHMQHDTRYSADNPYTGNSFVRTPMATTAQMAAAVTAAAPTVPLVAAAAAVPAAAMATAAAAAMPVYGPPAPNFLQRVLIAFQRNSMPVTAPVPVNALELRRTMTLNELEELEDVNALDEVEELRRTMTLDELEALEDVNAPSPLVPAPSPALLPQGVSVLPQAPPRANPTPLLLATPITRGASGATPPTAPQATPPTAPQAAPWWAQIEEREDISDIMAPLPAQIMFNDEFDDAHEFDDFVDLEPDYVPFSPPAYVPFSPPYTGGGTARQGYTPLRSGADRQYAVALSAWMAAERAEMAGTGTPAATRAAEAELDRAAEALHQTPRQPYRVMAPGGTVWEYAPESGSTIVDTNGPGARAQRGSAGQGSSTSVPVTPIAWPIRNNIQSPVTGRNPRAVPPFDPPS